MGKQVDFRLAKVAGPPEGVAWVWHTIELRSSPAWKARSNQLALLLELLELEHLRHGGAENGHLKQTFNQIASGGLSRKFIAATIEEGEALGLIEAQRGARKSSTESHMTAFRLTYLPAKVTDQSYQNGKPYYTAPSDQWKRVTEPQAAHIARQARARRATATGDMKNKKCSPEREPNQFQNGNSDGSRTGTGPAESRRNARPEKAQTVPEREHPSISWPPSAAERTDQPSATPAEPEQQPPAEGRDETHAAPVTDQPARRHPALPRPTPPVARQPVALPVGPATAAAMQSKVESQQQPVAVVPVPPAPVSAITHDPRQLDLVAFVEQQTGKPSSSVAPVDQLRTATKGRLATSPKGTHTRLAAWLGISSCTLSNFLSKGGARYQLNTCAEGRLREWVDGHLDLAPTGDAAA